MLPLVLLHGALGAEQQLADLKTALSQNGRSVYTINFSGHGGAPFKEKFGIEQFAADVSEFLELQHSSRVDIFGYSMGGYVGLWLAAHSQSVNRVVTLGTKFDWNPASAQHEVKKVNPEKIEEKIPAFARILEKRHQPNDWKELLQKTGDMMLALGDRPLLAESILTNISNEVLILLGSEDDMADKATSVAVARQLQKGKFRLLERTQHPIERVELNMLVQEIESFLSV